MLKSKKNIKNFLLDPEIHYLNHGSFGACPVPVFEEYVRLERQLEREPIVFLDREVKPALQASRQALADFVGCGCDDLVYFPNPTTAINMVARSIDFKPGDEILATNHEYGAMDRTWSFIAEKRGVLYHRRPIPLPVSSHQAFAEHFWSGVTDRTKVIFLSHITSQTALIFPVAEICRRAREAGILTVIDGAHAPGQIDLNLTEIQPDVYTGACHKWLCAPKGAAFLYASPEVQDWLEPLVISWGYQAESPSGSQFIDHHEWQGTRDISAFLSVPAAIDFQVQQDWSSVREACHKMVLFARDELHAVTGLEKVCLEDEEWIGQMAAIPLPDLNAVQLQSRLFDEYRIEVPVYRWEGQPFLRVSVQAYNTLEDIEALVVAMETLLPQEAV